ncbi:hypothetical protein [Burkholderia pseudomallei]|uniref:hypothetical protein n=1 Tax=Burkholderia pseudomallei TaxID=28450 RepID=UPI00141700C7|nr:hypothetical protein [Burkholderia pseudomallei]
MAAGSSIATRPPRAFAARASRRKRAFVVPGLSEAGADAVPFSASPVFVRDPDYRPHAPRYFEMENNWFGFCGGSFIVNSRWL